MVKKAETNMLSVSEVAKRLGAAKRSVQMWAQMGRFKGARQVEWPGGSYWLIPESALEGFELRGRGRPPKTKPVGKRSGDKQ